MPRSDKAETSRARQWPAMRWVLAYRPSWYLRCPAWPSSMPHQLAQTVDDTVASARILLCWQPPPATPLPPNRPPGYLSRLHPRRYRIHTSWRHSPLRRLLPLSSRRPSSADPSASLSSLAFIHRPFAPPRLTLALFLGPPLWSRRHLPLLRPSCPTCFRECESTTNLSNPSASFSSFPSILCFQSGTQLFGQRQMDCTCGATSRGVSNLE